MEGHSLPNPSSCLLSMGLDLGRGHSQHAVPPPSAGMGGRRRLLAGAVLGGQFSQSRSEVGVSWLLQTQTLQAGWPPCQGELEPKAPLGTVYLLYILHGSGMSQEATEAPAMPGEGHGHNKAKARWLLGTGRKRSRINRTRQDLWEDTSWSNHRLSRATSAPRGTRARRTAHGRVRTLIGGNWGRQGLEGSDVPPLKEEAPSVLMGLPMSRPMVTCWRHRTAQSFIIAKLRELMELISTEETQTRGDVCIA